MLLATWLAIVLSAVASFHLPAFDAVDTLPCVTSSNPNTDLESCFVMAQLRGSKTATVVARLYVAGMQGQLDSVFIPIDAPASVWVYTTDHAGNRSCDSHVMGINVPPTLGVPPDATTVARTQWFDVAGRRVAKPNAPGIYYWRRGRDRGVSVLVR